MHSRIQDVDPPILSSFSVRQDGIRTHTLALASHFSYVSARFFFSPFFLGNFLRLSVHHICMRSSDTQSLPSSAPLSLPPGIPHRIDGMGGVNLHHGLFWHLVLVRSGLVSLPQSSEGIWFTMLDTSGDICSAFSFCFYTVLGFVIGLDWDWNGLDR